MNILSFIPFNWQDEQGKYSHLPWLGAHQQCQGIKQSWNTCPASLDHGRLGLYSPDRKRKSSKKGLGSKRRDLAHRDHLDEEEVGTQQNYNPFFLRNSTSPLQLMTYFDSYIMTSNIPFLSITTSTYYPYYPHFQQNSLAFPLQDSLKPQVTYQASKI